MIEASGVSPVTVRNLSPNRFTFANEVNKLYVPLYWPSQGLAAGRPAWQTRWILSPVLLPSAWHWKHVGAALKAVDFEPVTMPA